MLPPSPVVVPSKAPPSLRCCVHRLNLVNTPRWPSPNGSSTKAWTPQSAQSATLDNALAETTVGSFKNELIRRQGPWRDVNQVELATAEWVVWFNTERPHEYLDDFTPEAAEKLHYDHKRTPPKAG